MWLSLFHAWQEFEILTDTLYQDNQSVINMETKERNVYTGSSKHVDITFFSKDCVDNG